MSAIATTQTKDVDQAKLLSEGMSGFMVQWELGSALNSVAHFITTAHKDVHDMGRSLNHSRGHTVLPLRIRLPFRPRLLPSSMSGFGTRV